MSGKSWTKNDFIRVHRIKTKKSGIAPIIARFVRSDSKLCALGSRQRLRDSGYGVKWQMTCHKVNVMNLTRSRKTVSVAIG